MPLSVDQWKGEFRNFNNRVVSNFLFCSYDICSAYRKLISVMCSLFLASVVMFFQTIINLFLLKSYNEFHPFPVRNVLVSFYVFNYMVWLCRMGIIILDIIKWWYWDESRSKAYLWTKFFNLPLEFKQYFSPQFYQNFSSDCLRSSP